MTATLDRDLTAPTQLAPVDDRSLPWAKLGVDFRDREVTTAAEACKRGGLNFTVTAVPAAFMTDDGVHVVDNRRAVIRRDTGAFFEFVSDTYRPVQFRDAFAFLESVSARFVAAGPIDGGRSGHVVATLTGLHNRNPRIGGRVDPHRFYVVVRSSHDADSGIAVAVVPIRNRGGAALSLRPFTKGVHQRWSFRHDGIDDATARQAKADITRTRVAEYIMDYASLADALANVPMTPADARILLEDVLPAKPRRPRQIRAIIEAWQYDDINGYPDNAWGLVNGVSAYLLWGRSEGLRTDRSRLTDVITGATFKMTNATVARSLRRDR